jgi:hypothetical protein
MALFYHSLHAQEFINRIVTLQRLELSHRDNNDGHSLPTLHQSLDNILRTAQVDEATLKEILAESNDLNSLLMDPYAGLISLFVSPVELRTSCLSPHNMDSHREQTLFPLPQDMSHEPGAPSTVATLPQFLNNWSVFTEHALTDVSWNNIVVAGGAVTACLLPIGVKERRSNTALQQHYYTKMFPSSDIDFFLFGMSEEEVRTIVSIGD